MFSDNCSTWIMGSLIFHTSTNKWCFWINQWHSLTLHVGTHEGTVRVIVFQERNTCCRNGNYLFRRNIHEIYKVWWVLLVITLMTTHNDFFCKCSIFVQFRVSLSNCVLIFFVGSQPNYFVGYFTSCTVNLTIWCLNKTILVKVSVWRQVIDQTDVRSFRCFNWTHTTVVRVVHVTNFISGTVTCQTTRSQGWQTTFVWQLWQWVVLVHELWQLWRTEEFFNSCSYRTNIDDLLWCQGFIILNWHTFTHVSFHTSQTNTELVSKQFTNGTDTTVTKVVDIIYFTDTFSKVEEVAHFSQDIRCCQSMNFIIWIGITNNCNHTIWIIWCNDLEFLKNNRFCNHCIIVWCVYKFVQITVQVFCDWINHITCHFSPSFNKDFTCFRIYQVFSNCLSQKTCLDVKFFVKFVTTNSSQVVTTWVKETSYKQATWAVSSFWFTWTKSFINFFKRFISTWICWIFVDIFFNSVTNQLAITKDINNFVITWESKCTHKRCEWNLTRTVDTSVGDVFWISFKLKPCPTVRNNCWSVTHFTVFIDLIVKVNTRWAHQLRNDNTFTTIDDKSTHLSHNWEISEEDFLSFDFTSFFVNKTESHKDRCWVWCIVDTSFFKCILRLFQFVTNEFQFHSVCEVWDRKYILKNLFKTSIQEFFEWIRLDFNQVW